MLEMINLREFYCIRCRSLHKVELNNHSLRVLSTAYHIVGEQRYPICICDASCAYRGIISDEYKGVFNTAE